MSSRDDLKFSLAHRILRIPTKAITNSDLIRSAIRRHADHPSERSDAGGWILTEVIGIRQRMR